MNLALFDIDGTLTKTHGLCDGPFAEAVQSVLGGPMELDWTLYPDVTDSGITHAAFERRLGRGPTAEELERVREHYFRNIDGCATGAEAMPGAPTVLRRLHGDGRWVVAIATGNWTPVAHRKLEWCGIDWKEVPLATADDAMKRADILRAAIRRTRAEDGRAVYLGDALWDQAAARELGIGFVRVGSRRFDAEHVLDDFQDFDALLSVLDGAVRC